MSDGAVADGDGELAAEVEAWTDDKASAEYTVPALAGAAVDADANERVPAATISPSVSAARILRIDPPTRFLLTIVRPSVPAGAGTRHPDIARENIVSMISIKH